MTVLNREDLIEASVMRYARDAIIARGFTQGQDFDIQESFPYKVQRFDRSLVSAGFAFDDGGRLAELGSNLKTRVHTIEFFVFGKTNTYGRSIASAIRYALERDQIIPLLDISQPNAPKVDILYLDAVSVRRQVIPEPEPWQEYVWLVSLTVTDIYDATLA